MFNLDATTKQQIVDTFHVPPKPGVLEQLEQLSDENNHTALLQAADIIAQDVGLASIVLQTINSPLFGLQRQVSDIKQAVVALGLKTVITVVQARLLKQAFQGKSAINLERFWDESCHIALICHHLGQKISLNFSPEFLYSLGLFHNVGIAAMALKYGDYADTLAVANNCKEKTFTEVEQKRYEKDHSQIGYVVSDNWHLPEKLCEVIANHHDIEYITEAFPFEQQELASVLRCATNVYSQLRNQRDENDWSIISAHVLDTLELSNDDYQTLLADIASRLDLTSPFKLQA